MPLNGLKTDVKIQQIIETEKKPQSKPELIFFFVSSKPWLA